MKGPDGGTRPTRSAVKRTPRNGGRGERGLTLVELLVTMVVASLVASSTFVFFAGQKSMYETQTKLLNVQQNLWAALETVTMNVRSEGSSMIGCVRPASTIAGDTGDPPPVGATPPQTGLRAWIKNPAIAPYVTPAMNRLAPIWIENGAGAAPDRLTIVYGVGASGNFKDADLTLTVGACNNPITLPVAVPPMTDMFRGPVGGNPGELFLLVHNAAVPNTGNLDRGCTLFQLTSISGNTTLNHAGAAQWNKNAPCAGMFTWGFPIQAPGSYTTAGGGAVRNFGQIRWIRFAIITTAGVPNLTMQRLDIVVGGVRSAPQVLAEGIENMQIAFGCDLGAPGGLPPDGIITEDLIAPTADEWFLNAPGDFVDPRCNRPQAVRITISARSPSVDTTLSGTTTNARAAAEDSPAGPIDGFRHRVIRTTVFPRNF